MALRRWKPFLEAFDHIDAAIVSVSAAGGVGPEDIISRGQFKRARNRIVETLCGATDDAVAEALCLLLGDAMAESLVTLQAARVENHRDLLVSGELVAAVGALARGHGSERVRGLARGLVRRWRAAVEEDLATAMAAMRALDAASGGVDVVAGGGRVDAVKTAEPSPKKTTPLAVRRNCGVQGAARVPVPQLQPKKATTLCNAGDEKKTKAMKRKLHERYQEAEDAKRRRTVEVLVVAPAGDAAARARRTPPSRHAARRAPMQRAPALARPSAA